MPLQKNEMAVSAFVRFAELPHDLGCCYYYMSGLATEFCQELGHVDSYNIIGDVHLTGNRAERDENKAGHYLELAAITEMTIQSWRF